MMYLEFLLLCDCGMLVWARLVTVDQTDARWIGANNLDNIAAELQAAIAAMTVALCGDVLDHIVSRPDLKLSAMLAPSSWRCAVHPKLAHLCQVLGSWYAKVGGDFVEVRGHWNELADSPAKHAALHSQAVGSLDWPAFAHLLGLVA